MTQVLVERDTTVKAHYSLHSALGRMKWLLGKYKDWEVQGYELNSFLYPMDIDAELHLAKSFRVPTPKGWDIRTVYAEVKFHVEAYAISVSYCEYVYELSGKAILDERTYHFNRDEMIPEEERAQLILFVLKHMRKILNEHVKVLS